MDTSPSQRLIAREAEADAPFVEAVVGRAFGPGRYAKTAERLREGNRPYADLCFVARQAGDVIASVRLWPVRIGGTEVAFLGPIAVDPQRQSQGTGRALIETAVDAAFAKGIVAVVLVGTPALFEKLGFVRAENLTLPGPVDYRRVMIRYRPGYDGPPLTGHVGR